MPDQRRTDYRSLTYERLLELRGEAILLRSRIISLSRNDQLDEIDRMIQEYTGANIRPTNSLTHSMELMRLLVPHMSIVTIKQKRGLYVIKFSGRIRGEWKRFYSRFVSRHPGAVICAEIVKRHIDELTFLMELWLDNQNHHH